MMEKFLNDSGKRVLTEEQFGHAVQVVRNDVGPKRLRVKKSLATPTQWAKHLNFSTQESEKYRDRINKSRSRYYHENKEKVLDSQKDYYLRNKSQINKRNREYGERNKEHLKKKKKEYNEKNKGQGSCSRRNRG